MTTFRLDVEFEVEAGSATEASDAIDYALDAARAKMESYDVSVVEVGQPIPMVAAPADPREPSGVVLAILSSSLGQAAAEPLADAIMDALSEAPLAGFTVQALYEEIRRRSAVVCVFTPEDVFDRYNGASADAVAWLATNARRIEDRMASVGNEVIDDLLSYDGKLLDDAED